MCMYIYFASVLPSFTASLFRRLFTPTPAGGQAELKGMIRITRFTFRSLYTINSFRYFSKIFFTPPIRFFLLILSTLAMHALDPTKSVESHCKFLHALTWPYTPFLLQIGS